MHTARRVPVAQLVEQLTFNQWARDSSSRGRTKNTAQIRLCLTFRAVFFCAFTRFDEYVTKFPEKRKGETPAVREQRKGLRPGGRSVSPKNGAARFDEDAWGGKFTSETGQVKSGEIFFS